MLTIKLEMKGKSIGEIERGLPGLLEKVLDKATFDIEAGAEDRTVRVDTSAMKAGWQTKKLERYVRKVFNTQDYAIHHEFGTVHMSATPMLIPAAEDVAKVLPEVARQMVERL